MKRFPLTTLIRLYELLKNSRLMPQMQHQQQRSLARSELREQAALVLIDVWWRMTGSNRRPPACKAGALPAELIPLGGKDGGSGWSRTNDPRLIKTVL